MNLELEDAIAADPDDDRAYLVYADWLQQQGDPRGELIALDHAGKTDEADALRERLLGPLAPWRHALTWRHGFIRTARLSVGGRGDPPFDGALDRLYDLLIRHPCGGLVVELQIGLNRRAHNSHQSMINAMCRTPPPALRALRLGYELDELLPRHGTGDLGRLWRVLPRLRALVIRGGSWSLGDLDLPALRELELRAEALPIASAAALGTAKLPALESLRVGFGAESPCRLDQLRLLVNRTDLPALRRLALQVEELGDGLCGILPRARLLSQLTHLDLSGSAITDHGARALAAHSGALRHLEVLDVSRTFLTEDGVASLMRCATRVIAQDLQEDRYDSVEE